MSEFYGRVSGSRGEATRCGSKSSGIRVTAETWSSVVCARQYESSGTASGHEAVISVGGKHGGDCLYLSFDADTLYQYSDDPKVSAALEGVRDAMRAADEAAYAAATAAAGSVPA